MISIRKLVGVVLMIVGGGFIWFSMQPLISALFAGVVGLVPGMEWLVGTAIGVTIITIGAYIGRRKL